MTVSELIAKLQQAPQDAEVVTYDEDCDYIVPIGRAEMCAIAVDGLEQMYVHIEDIEDPDTATVKQMFMIA